MPDSSGKQNNVM